MADEDISRAELRYRELFEEAPISLWEEDFSGVKAYLEWLREEGVNDLREYFLKNPEALLECVRLVKVLDVNGYTLELYGVGSKQEFQNNLGKFLSEETYPFLMEQLLAFADGRQNLEGEMVSRTLQGERLDIYLKWIVMPDSQPAYSRVLVTIVDISERKQAEEKLKESEHLYRMLADNTQDLICVNDTQYIRRYVSPSYKKVLGYEPEELLGQPIVNLLHPNDLEEAGKVMSEHTAAGITGVMRIRNRHKDGHYVWLESQGTPLFNEEGSPVGGMTASRVVTGQVEAEEKLRDSNEQLKNFLAVAAHELRHPICLVQGYANTLVDFRQDMTQEVLSEIYESIGIASRRLTNLVEELLEVSRIEKERFHVDRSEVEPQRILERVVEEMRERGVGNPFEIRMAAGVGAWSLDPDKFHQLMVILLDNAVNYSPPGSPVEVEMEETVEGLSLSVLDRGRGVSAAERGRIFQRFYQVEDPRHHSVPGLGLGLYIAREIVEGHGGRIRCEPREGGGSAFRVTLP